MFKEANMEEPANKLSLLWEELLGYAAFSTTLSFPKLVPFVALFFA